MYANMSYGNGKEVQVGDILYHKRWQAKGQPLKLEVVKSAFFGHGLPGKITVVLREINMWGCHSYISEALPQRNGGVAYVNTRDVRFSGRGVPETSVFAPAKKRFSRDEGDHDE